MGVQISILGHSRGIGKAAAEHFQKNDCRIIGFSRSNGFDINTDFKKIAELCKESQVIINSAPAIFGQVEFLYELFPLIRERETLVINISSNNTDGIRTRRPHPHSSSKVALEHAVRQLQYQKSVCQLSLLKLGYVDSPRADAYTQPKVDISAVLKAMDWIILNKESFLVREIYLSHKDMELDP